MKRLKPKTLCGLVGVGAAIGISGWSRADDAAPPTPYQQALKTAENVPLLLLESKAVLSLQVMGKARLSVLKGNVMVLQPDSNIAAKN